MIIVLLICLLISNAVTTNREQSILFSRAVIKGIILTSIICYNNLFIVPLERGVGIYGGLFNVTTFTSSFDIFILIVSGVVLTLTAFFPRKLYMQKYHSLYYLLSSKLMYNKNEICNTTGEQFRIIEYPLIIIFILTGALFLISAGDLISIFLSIELQSYGLYILCSLYRNSESSTASGLTYFLLGGMSSCFILLGSGLLYANSGTTNLDNLYIITSISEVASVPHNIYMYKPFYLHMSLIVFCIGFLFKVSAAPFHFWSPDVYDGIPTIVTTYVAIIAKISVFAFLLELVYYTESYFMDFSWKIIFLLSSTFSLIIGSVLGLSQFRIKRLFAYSTISHVGFILLALSVNSTESIQSYIFYILQYSISNLNAFIILIAIGYTYYSYGYSKEGYAENNDLIDINNSPIQLISQIKGYFYVNSFIAISFTITLLSFVGIPPVIGFFAKQMVLSAALDKGYIFITLIAILTSVIGAAYYLNLIKQIFFYKGEYRKNLEMSKQVITGYIQPINSKFYNNSSTNLISPKIKQFEFNINDITINSSISSSISIITLLLLLFIYVPNEWFNIVSILTLILFKS